MEVDKNMNVITEDKKVMPVSKFSLDPEYFLLNMDSSSVPLNKYTSNVIHPSSCPVNSTANAFANRINLQVPQESSIQQGFLPYLNNQTVTEGNVNQADELQNDEEFSISASESRRHESMHANNEESPTHAFSPNSRHQLSHINGDTFGARVMMTDVFLRQAFEYQEYQPIKNQE